MKRFTQDGLNDEIAEVFGDRQSGVTFKGVIHCCLHRAFPPVVTESDFKLIVDRVGPEFEYHSREQMNVGADPDVYSLCALPMMGEEPDKLIDWRVPAPFSSGTILGLQGQVLPIRAFIYSAHNGADSSYAISFEWEVDPTFRLVRADFRTPEEAKEWAEWAAPKFAALVGEQILTSSRIRVYVVKRGELWLHRELRPSLEPVVNGRVRRVWNGGKVPV